MAALYPLRPWTWQDLICCCCSEITQCNGHYAVEGHSRSPMLVPIKLSSYATSYYWLILTYLLSGTVSKLWLIIGQIFASERGVPHINALAEGWSPAGIAINDISQKKTTFFGLLSCCRMYRCIFNHFYVMHPKSYRIRWTNTNLGAITPFKVIQGHQVWYQLKAHMRFSISD